MMTVAKKNVAVNDEKYCHRSTGTGNDNDNMW